MLTLKLPYPPSKNELHDNRNAISKNGKPYTARMNSEKYKAYKEEVWLAAQRIKARAIRDPSAPRIPLTGPLQVTIIASPPRLNRRRDVTNLLDGLLDSLHKKARRGSPGIILDDSQFARTVIEWTDPSEFGSVVLKFERYQALAAGGLFK